MRPTRSVGAPVALATALPNLPTATPAAQSTVRALMRLVADRGFVSVLVTSQRCVGKGLITVDELEIIHDKLRSELAAQDLFFLDIYAFLGTPETASWEKPSPDMILLAAEKHRIDLSASWMIGDADRDIVMGQRAGVGKTLRIITDKAVGVDADFTADDLSGAHEILSEHLA